MQVILAGNAAELGDLLLATRNDHLFASLDFGQQLREVRFGFADLLR